MLNDNYEGCYAMKFKIIYSAIKIKNDNEINNLTILINEFMEEQ